MFLLPVTAGGISATPGVLTRPEGHARERRRTPFPLCTLAHRQNTRQLTLAEGVL